MLSGFISYLIGLSLLKANFNLSVKQIHYDNGEEFHMKHFFFQENQIIHEHSCMS